MNKVDLIAEWYANHYHQINATAREDSIFSRVLHKSLEKSHKSNTGLQILEVGSNKAEHSYFVEPSWKSGGSYLATDIRIPSKKDLDVLIQLGITFAAEDVQDMSFESCKFDRVISTCLFHHLPNPIQAFEEIRRVTKIGGAIDILIPNDPGLMYHLLRNLTTLRKARKKNVLEKARLIHALEHQNNFLSLMELAKHVFQNDSFSVRGFPFFFNSFNLNAFTVVSVKRKF